MKTKWYLWEAAGMLAADQIMKTYAEQNLENGEEKHLGNKVILRFTKNKGMCMNLLEDRPDLVCLCSVIAAAAVTGMQAAALIRGKSFWKKQGLTLLAAGAWSNTGDRLFRGYVADYIGFRSDNQKISRITYNIADFIIAAGVFVLSSASVFQKHKPD